MNKEQMSKSEAMLQGLDARFNFEGALKELQADVAAQNWCGEGCRGDCKGGGFSD